MPVSLLLCEGTANSPDIRVLTKLLAGRCALLPGGGKYGMGDRIKARRETMGRRTVYGLLDGDFVADYSTPTNQPRRWEGSDGTHLGWRWQRNEIENYLVDPTVVQHALGTKSPPDADYRRAIEGAREAIAVYQAVRVALSVLRPGFAPLANSFGRERGRERHPFPETLDLASCQAGAQDVVARYRAKLLVSDADLAEELTARLPECEPGGVRFRDFLAAFSGKDLVWAMDSGIPYCGHLVLQAPPFSWRCC